MNIYLLQLTTNMNLPARRPAYSVFHNCPTETPLNSNLYFGTRAERRREGEIADTQA
jgi:hypothetical protein